MPDTDCQAQLAAPPLHPGKDIPVEGAQRGDIDCLEPSAGGQGEESVKDREHRTLGLAGTGRGDQDNVVSRDRIRGMACFWASESVVNPALPDAGLHSGVQEFNRLSSGYQRCQGADVCPVGKDDLRVVLCPCTARAVRTGLSRS